MAKCPIIKDKLMSKKEIKPNISVRFKPEIKVPKEKKHFFPKLSLLLSLFFIALAIVNFFEFYLFPKSIINGALLLAGLMVFKKSIAEGFYSRRKEIIKRYI